jgi:5-methylcytosine-specific restriction endonuclease McrA
MPFVRCKLCGERLYAKPNWLRRGWGKYCSPTCQHKAQLRGKFVFCKICGKKIWRTPKELKHSKSQKYFCGKSCQTLWRNKFYSGPKHPLWNGGLSRYRKILLGTKIVPICSKCGYKNEKVLIVHHKDGDRKNKSLKNLEWLCRNCHYLAHNRITF